MAEIENQKGSRTCKGWKGAKLLWLVTHFFRKRHKSIDTPKEKLCPIHWMPSMASSRSSHVLAGSLACQSVFPSEDWEDSPVTWTGRQHRTLNFFKQVQKTCVTHSMLSGAAACLRSTPWILAFVVICEGCCQYNYYKGSPAHTVCSVPWVILRHS